MNHKAIERKSLTISSIVNGLSGLAGVAVYIMTDLNALLLDGVFSLIAFVSSLVAVYISKNSHKKNRNLSPRPLLSRAALCDYEVSGNLTTIDFCCTRNECNSLCLFRAWKWSANDNRSCGSLHDYHVPHLYRTLLL